MEKPTRQRKGRPRTLVSPTEHQKNVQLAVFMLYGYEKFAADVNGEDVYIIRDNKYIKVLQVLEDWGI
jgi:hypothetical protein